MACVDTRGYSCVNRPHTPGAGVSRLFRTDITLGIPSLFSLKVIGEAPLPT